MKTIGEKKALSPIEGLRKLETLNRQLKRIAPRKKINRIVFLKNWRDADRFIIARAAKRT